MALETEEVLITAYSGKLKEFSFFVSVILCTE